VPGCGQAGFQAPARTWRSSSPAHCGAQAVSHTFSVPRWFPLWFPDNLPSRSTYSLTWWWAQLGSNQ
jgi:hypothetical protein